MRSSPGRTPALRRMRGGGAAPRAMTAEPFQVRVPSVGWVMRPPAATSCGSSSNEGLSSSTKRSRDTHDVRGPVSPSGMRFMRPPRSGPTVRNTSSLSFRPTLPTSSTSRAEGESGFTPSIVTGAHNAGYQKRGNGLKSVFVRGGFVDFRRKRARRADAAYKRQLERGIERIDSEAEAEEVHFEALDRARGEAGEPEQRKLQAASARGGPDEFLPGIILADRRRGQIGFELGHRAQHPGGESVRVRTGPHGVFAGPGIGMRGLVEDLIARIDKAAHSYPWAGEYTMWPGPNSNTFTAWVLRTVPELEADLPPTAIGKDYSGKKLVGSAPSGRGFQFSFFGLAGLTASSVEGFEVNVLGLTFGINPFDPSLKLPLLGRVGPARALASKDDEAAAGEHAL